MAIANKKVVEGIYGPIMAMDLKEIEKLIKEALPDALIEIQDLAGDGNHYSANSYFISIFREKVK